MTSQAFHLVLMQVITRVELNTSVLMTEHASQGEGMLST